MAPKEIDVRSMADMHKYQRGEKKSCHHAQVPGLLRTLSGPFLTARSIDFSTINVDEKGRRLSAEITR